MPTSRATRVTSDAKARSWSTIVLIVSLSSKISPLTSTVIFFERSPFATAVVTVAMLRTCSVSDEAMKLTLSVRSRHVPETPFTRAWPPSLPSVPTSRATRVTSSANEPSWSTIVLIVFLSRRISPRASTVIFCERSPFATAVVTSAIARTWPVRLPASWFTFSVRSFQVPREADDLGLAAELALGADLLRDARDLGGERGELVDHRVDRQLQLLDLALDVDRHLLREVAVRDGCRDLGDVAHLAGEVRREGVDVLGQGPPDARDALDLRLDAELAVGADLLGDAGHLGGERAELVDHRVDRRLELGHLALRVDGDLLREVALRDRGRDVGDRAHLARQVAGEQVDVVGEAAPRAGDALHLRLAAEDPLGADLARDARHLVGERGELVDHRVDRRGELGDLALRLDRDLLRQVALRDRGRDVGDRAHLGRQVVGHQVHVLGQPAPDAGDALDLGLAAELALGADLARDARDLGGERGELVDHRVDRVLELERPRRGRRR